MCGIIGALCPQGSLNTERLEPAIRALKHRGPDGQGVWADARGQAALGHTRLGLVGLERGQQPLSSEDGQLWAVVNGEFYGFEAQRRALIARGHRFSTETDSEVLIHLYEEYGAHAVSRLRGEFAAILWDGRKRQLFAWRDRFGVKPLCWTLRPDGQLLLASEAKALFALGAPARWDTESLFGCAQLHYTLPHRTMFEHILQLPPGHMLIASPGQPPHLIKYWDWDYPKDTPASPGPDDQATIARFGQLLEESVALRMRADVEVGCYLSGGLDSCAILGIAQRLSDKPIRAFTISFDEEAYDEAPIAARQAARVGAQLELVHVSRIDALTHLSDAVYHGEGLAINGHLSAKYLLSRAVQRAGIKAVLVGEGADEIVAGYPHLRKDLWGDEAAKAATLEAANKVAAGIFLPQGQQLPLSGVAQTLGFVPTFFEAKATLGYRVCALLHEDFAAQWQGRDSYQVVLDHMDLRGQLTGRHKVNQSLYLWSKLTLANYILRQIGDATEMAHSVEGRVPYLDHKLVELCVGLPMHLKIRDMTEKYILREATKDVLTDEVYRRQKHALLAPPTRGQAQELVQDTLRSASFAKLRCFDHAKVVAMLDTLDDLSASERAVMDPALMLLLSAHALQERFGLEGL